MSIWSCSGRVLHFQLIIKQPHGRNILKNLCSRNSHGFVASRWRNSSSLSEEFNWTWQYSVTQLLACVSPNKAERTGLLPHSGPDNQVRGNLSLLILFSEVASPHPGCRGVPSWDIQFFLFTSEHQLGNSRTHSNISATKFLLPAPLSDVWSALFFQCPLYPEPKEEEDRNRLIKKARSVAILQEEMDGGLLCTN